MGSLRVLAIDVGGCEGCLVSIFRALPLLDGVDLAIRYIGPVSLDRDYDVAIVCGSVCINDEEKVELVRTIRRRARILVAYGSCASLGGVTRFCRGGQEPRPEHMIYKPVSSIVSVDYGIPGCPPMPQTLKTLLASLKGGVVTPLLKVFAAVARAEKLSGFDLLDDVVLAGLCVSCGACVLSCPTGALRMVEGKPDLEAGRCIRCGVCYVRCPRASHLLVSRYNVQPKLLGSGGSCASYTR